MLMIKTNKRITGSSVAESAFRVHETSQSLDVAKVFDVLRGDLAAYHVIGFVPPDACRRIADNFWASTEKVPRAGDGDDGVEGYLIGASHYGKPTLQYLEEASGFENALKNVYAGTINPGLIFKDALRSRDGKPINVRPARLNGLSAGDSKAVHWTGSGHFLLEPHDDLAQLRGPEQRDFEIQQADRVLAVNIYAEVPSNSGQVQLWNIEPDDETRADLDLTYVGFPYPAELLTEYPSMIIPVETGDLCVFNGNLVHAVLRGNTTSPKKRLLITFFMAFNHDHELIWWT
jgi:hypothetical protein